MIHISISNPSFESCSKCIHSDDSEEICILRRCIHAVAQLNECYVPKQQVVHCKDCTHYNAGFECLIEGYGIERNAEWYCADAERRTDG